MAKNLSRQNLLLMLFNSALEAVNGKTCVIQSLNDKSLHNEKFFLLATGKAATAMAAGAYEYLGEQIIDSLVVTKYGHCVEDKGYTPFHCIEAGHPVPDEHSLDAGQAIIEFINKIPANAMLLVLTSGGTSALVEALPSEVSLTDLIRLNQWLLSSGLDIEQMNRIRQSVSLLKAGRLLSYVKAKSILHLVISDVPDDELEIIGSGMLVEPEKTELIPKIDIPDWVVAMQNAAQSENEFKKDKNISIRHEIIANNKKACDSVANTAREYGYTAYIHHEGLSGDVEQCARLISQYLIQQAASGIHIWGGETTVTLPKSPGRGGRNQQLALIIARELNKIENITVLAAGTDGSDGMTSDAGAIVDNKTIIKGSNSGMDINTFIKNANAGEFLFETGDLINTGVTGTNVMDLLIAFKTD